MTIEQACLSTPAVPQSERKNGVLVLAKLPDYFHLRHFTPTTHAFDYIAKAMKGIELWTTAHKHKEEGKHPIPSDLVQLGPQEPAKYVELLSSARALLGVGKPEISPTPYEAL